MFTLIWDRASWTLQTPMPALLRSTCTFQTGKQHTQCKNKPSFIEQLKQRCRSEKEDQVDQVSHCPWKACAKKVKGACLRKHYCSLASGSYCLLKLFSYARILSAPCWHRPQLNHNKCKVWTSSCLRRACDGTGKIKQVKLYDVQGNYKVGAGQSRRGACPNIFNITSSDFIC